MAKKSVELVEAQYRAIVRDVSETRVPYTAVVRRCQAWYRKASQSAVTKKDKRYSNRLMKDAVFLRFWAALYYEEHRDVEKAFAQLSKLRLTATNRVSKMWWVFCSRKDRGDLEAASLMLREIERRIRVSRPRVKWPTKKMLAEARAEIRTPSTIKKLQR